jgi:hypothetical protein
MRIRRRLAAGTAVVFAALGVLSPAPVASAATIGVGHELLPLSITTNTDPARYNEVVNAITPPACPAGSVQMRALSLPGDELTPTKWVTWGQTRLPNAATGAVVLDPTDLSIDSLWFSALSGYNSGGSKGAGSPWLLAWGSYDVSYSFSVSCWNAEVVQDGVGVQTPGTPVYLTTVKKISLAESQVLYGAAGKVGYYRIVPLQVVTESAPAAPAGVTATATEGALTANWGAVSATPAVTGYKVYVTAGGTPIAGSPFTAAATAISLSVPGLSAGTTYTVSVSATNSVGDSPASTTATAIPNPIPDVILSTGTVTAQVIVAASTAGTISMTVPLSGVADLGKAADQPNGTRTASGTLGAVTVSDLRVDAEKTPWKVQATTDNFNPLVGTVGAFSSTSLGSAPRVTSTGTGVVAGPAQPATTAPLLRLLASGTKGASGTVDADLSLVVPVGTPVGTYTSKITIDLVKA